MFHFILQNILILKGKYSVTLMIIMYHLTAIDYGIWKVGHVSMDGSKHESVIFLESWFQELFV